MDSEDHKMTPGEWQLFNHQKKLDKVIEKTATIATAGTP